MPDVALVVDDSMVIRHTVSRFLEERGFAVESASNGLEALEILKRVQPALLITDMQMPGMSGSELISVLKSKPETAAIPILILTGRSSGFERQRESRRVHRSSRISTCRYSSRRLLPPSHSRQPKRELQVNRLFGKLARWLSVPQWQTCFRRRIHRGKILRKPFGIGRCCNHGSIVGRQRPRREEDGQSQLCGFGFETLP